MDKSETKNIGGKTRMKKGLIIVESPTKAKTISGILGNDYVVMATMGHVRDLPDKDMGINIEKDFEPKYVIIPGKKTVAANLKKAAGEHDNVYLATDEDREGEAIAWHIMHIIGKKPSEIKRVAFHEIVPEAVREAFRSPRSISLNLVDAQQARRILDRIVGYTISPFLGRGLSAGRVQSVALRLIVEREKEIEGFVSQVYWTVKANGEKNGKSISLELTEISGKKIEKYGLKEPGAVDKILEELKKKSMTVTGKDTTTRKVKPYPPFITSTLQQEASIRLGFSSSRTMAVAQQLYEGVATGEGSMGLITYMRTDSPSVAKPAKNQVIKYIGDAFGKEYLPEKPNFYKSKSSSAQEAHEAIRPTSALKTPEKMKPFLKEEQYKLYRLIWERFIASQMKEAEIESTKISAENGKYGFSAESNTVRFDGFMKLWDMKIDTGEECAAEIEKGEVLNIADYVKEEHKTNPPPRYTEASLIKTLEKHGIGRPSTYAPTISILLNRGYVKTEKRALVPLKIGRVVYEILMQFFPDIIKIDFTARMEDDLDKIAEGEMKWTEILHEFYKDYKPLLEKAKGRGPEYNEIFNKILAADKMCPNCKVPMVVKKGRYGMFLGCPNFPKCTYKDSIINEEVASEDKACPKCGIPLVVKKGKFGAFYGCPNYPECKHTERIKKNAHYSRNRFKKK